MKSANIQYTSITKTKIDIDVEVTDAELDILLSIKNDYSTWTKEQLDVFNKHRGHVLNEIRVQDVAIIEDIDDEHDINITRQI